MPLAGGNKPLQSAWASGRRKVRCRRSSAPLPGRRVADSSAATAPRTVPLDLRAFEHEAAVAMIYPEVDRGEDQISVQWPARREALPAFLLSL
jgi:hypothetical protein